MSENARRSAMRGLPAVDRILSQQPIRELEGQVPHSIVLNAARLTLDDVRARIMEGNAPGAEDLSPERIAHRARELALHLNRPSLHRVINGTGVVLHTGLGRAVLPEAAVSELLGAASGHSNLEIDLQTGGRGSRKSHYAQLLAELTGAEAAMAVNNNAGAVFLALNTLAQGREVIISRGQLVEIGGSFRLPDIMARAGARLVEVGTTNRTRIADYEAAITEDTGLILRVHPSNFQIVGYTQEASLEELVGLGRRYGIPVVDDVGSGALVDLSRFGLKGDPIVPESVKAGADVVLFSGDKLLGGPQAGLIAGRKDIIDDIVANPIARALRIGKLTAAALEGTLRLYTDPDTVTEKIPTLRFIARPASDVAKSARKLRRMLTQAMPEMIQVEVMDGLSEVGGGSLPGQTLPTKLVSISTAKPGVENPRDLAKAFRLAAPPVFGRVGDDRFLLDLRTVEDSELPAIVSAARRILHEWPAVIPPISR
jgi:L-seryl-tRNA(Ser) seleniumtransferase